MSNVGYLMIQVAQASSLVVPVGKISLVLVLSSYSKRVALNSPESFINVSQYLWVDVGLWLALTAIKPTPE